MSADKHRNWDRLADLESIRTTYAGYDESRRARLWDANNPGYSRMASELRTSLLGHLRRSIHEAGPRVVDLGCGTGELARHAASSGIVSQWIGVDLRPNAIAEARRAHPAATFMVASADQVPLPADSVDVAISQVLFSSLPSAELEAAVAAEVRRLLRPGGWLVWADIRYPNPSNPAVHGVPTHRLAELFPEWKGELQTLGLLPPVARRLGVLAPVLYPLLSMLPALRSHLVGRLQKPVAVILD